MNKTLSFVKKYQKLIVILGLLSLLVLAFIITSFMVVGKYQKFVIKNQDYKELNGIVFGSGITKDGRPYKELQARLDTAADALNSGDVTKLLLSGDNRTGGYNEPDAMIKYLVETRLIDPAKLQADYAGRSSYETCERAVKIFGIKKAVLFSANSHLPRAIFLCRSFGIEAYGVGNSVEANNAGRREILARTKALFNVYIYGEQTILGPKIDF